MRHSMTRVQTNAQLPTRSSKSSSVRLPAKPDSIRGRASRLPVGLGSRGLLAQNPGVVLPHSLDVIAQLTRLKSLAPCTLAFRSGARGFGNRRHLLSLDHHAAVAVQNYEIAGSYVISADLDLDVDAARSVWLHLWIAPSATRSAAPAPGTRLRRELQRLQAAVSPVLVPTPSLTTMIPHVAARSGHRRHAIARLRCSWSSQLSWSS